MIDALFAAFVLLTTAASCALPLCHTCAHPAAAAPTAPLLVSV